VWSWPLALLGDDALTVSDSTDCSGGLHFGTIDLDERSFFHTGTVTFDGFSGTWGRSNTSGRSTIKWNGTNTLTITFGVVSHRQPSRTPSGTA
jgi:hypothetical protein